MSVQVILAMVSTVSARTSQMVIDVTVSLDSLGLSAPFRTRKRAMEFTARRRVECAAGVPRPGTRASVCLVGVVRAVRRASVTVKETMAV